MMSLMCGFLKKTEVELTEAESRWCLPGPGELGKIGRCLSKCKVPVM